MPAGADIELEAVPGTDDIQRAGAVMNSKATALGIESLLDPLHQLSLADRAALVRAIVAPRVKLAVDAKHADLDLFVDNNLALSIGHLVREGDKNLSHAVLGPSLAELRGM